MKPRPITPSIWPANLHCPSARSQLKNRSIQDFSYLFIQEEPRIIENWLSIGCVCLVLTQLSSDGSYGKWSNEHEMTEADALTNQLHNTACDCESLETLNILIKGHGLYDSNIHQRNKD